MQKGFLSFALGAVFLLSIVSSGAIISSSKPDTSYEKYRRLLVEGVAIKQALYSSLSDAAISSLASSSEAEGSQYAAVRAAVFARFLEFQEKLREDGYDALFWCGEISEEERSSAALQMLEEKRSILPSGSIAAAACADSLDVNLLQRSIHMKDVGFSFYDSSLGLGVAAKLPSSYEVEFK
ncbi:MAG: hypothetical protein QW568_00600 [Candidatus Anstonellaceae archaeon]